MEWKQGLEARLGVVCVRACREEVLFRRLCFERCCAVLSQCLLAFPPAKALGRDNMRAGRQGVGGSPMSTPAKVQHNGYSKGHLATDLGTWESSG